MLVPNFMKDVFCGIIQKNDANLHDKPWIIARDFNKVLAEGDKFGGRAISSNRSLLFKECLDYCNMIDMGFTGPRFTWINRWNC